MAVEWKLKDDLVTLFVDGVEYVPAQAREPELPLHKRLTLEQDVQEIATGGRRFVIGLYRYAYGGTVTLNDDTVWDFETFEAKWRMVKE